MQLEVLTSSQTAGATFGTRTPGLHLIAVSGMVPGNTVKLQWKSGNSWIDVDADRQDVATWKSDGIGVVDMSKHLEYRMTASTAGATALFESLEEGSVSGPAIYFVE